MTVYICYLESTGEIVGQGGCPDGYFYPTNVDEGYGLLEIDAAIDQDACYVLNGIVVPCDKKPSPFHKLQNGQWVLPDNLLQEIRAKDRIVALNSMDWMTTRHRDQRDAGGVTTLTEEEYAELLNYKQALRDWTEGPLPEPPVWM